MKILRFIEACIVCGCFIPFVTIYMIILFPISIIVEIATLIRECFTEDEWKHGWYAESVKTGCEFIKDIYLRIMNI